MMNPEARRGSSREASKSGFWNCCGKQGREYWFEPGFRDFGDPWQSHRRHVARTGAAGRLLSFADRVAAAAKRRASTSERSPASLGLSPARGRSRFSVTFSTLPPIGSAFAGFGHVSHLRSLFTSTSENLGMTAGWFLTYHEIPELVQEWLARLGVRDPDRGSRDLADLTRRAGAGIASGRGPAGGRRSTRSCPAALIRGWRLRTSSDSWPRCRSSARRCATWPAIRRMAEILLQVFSTSHYFSEVLIRDPQLLDWLRAGPERPDRASLVEDLWKTLSGTCRRERAVARAAAVSPAREPADRLQRHRSRAAAGADHAGSFRPGRCLRGRGVAAGAGSGRVSVRRAACRRRSAGAVRGAGAGQAGRAGAQLQLGHRPGLSLRPGRRDDRGRRLFPTPSSSRRMGSELVRLLAEHTALGIVYRVDMRLRPDGEQGALASPLDATLGYYVTRGRTWERQALIKCRAVAGDLELGKTFCDEIQPFVFRRFLGAAEIAEIKTLKRRIEQRHAFGRHVGSRGQDRPRRHSRHRVRGAVPAVAARRRVSRGAARDDADGDRPARASRLLEHGGTTASWMTITGSCAGSSTGCRFFSTGRRTRCRARRRRGKLWRCGWAICRRVGWEDRRRAGGAVHDRLSQQDRA